MTSAIQAWYYPRIGSASLAWHEHGRRSRNELGDFLRSRRERLTPKGAGLPAGRRRRTPGLRREEVAELAGIGVDWYIRLEQGRSVSPSLTTIDALARALRLSKVEHAHLRALTRNAAVAPSRAKSCPNRSEAGRREPRSAGLCHRPTLGCAGLEQGGRGDLLFSRLPEEDRNILILILTKPATRRVFGATWSDEAKRIVAQFRATHDLWADDPAFVELLDRLRRDSPEFTAWWKAHDIRAAAPAASR